MKEFYRLLRAESLKMRHTSFYSLHVGLPLVGLYLFLSYYHGFTGWDAPGKVQAYAEIVGVVFPLAGAIVVAMSVEQEAEAGAFKEMLSVEYSRIKIFLSKFIFLLIVASFSTFLAIGGFFIGFYYILDVKEIGGLFFVQLSIIMLLSQIGLYCLHMTVCLKRGRGITIGLGLMESLVAALFLTGLGDGLWPFVPCSWGPRLADSYLKAYLTGNAFTTKFNYGILIGITLMIIVLSMGSFCVYEGRKEIEE